jgi:hypothetical protein
MTKLDFLTQLCQVRDDLETVRLDLPEMHPGRVDKEGLLRLGERLDALIDQFPHLEDH